MSGALFHKGVCTLALVGLLWLLPAALQAQTPDPPHLVQGVITGLTNAHQAQQAANALRSVDGVLMVRADHVTANLMMHVRPDAMLDEAQLGALLQPLGYGVRCFRREVAGATPFRHVDPAACDTAHPER